MSLGFARSLNIEVKLVSRAPDGLGFIAFFFTARGDRAVTVAGTRTRTFVNSRLWSYRQWPRKGRRQRRGRCRKLLRTPRHVTCGSGDLSPWSCCRRPKRRQTSFRLQRGGGRAIIGSWTLSDRKTLCEGHQRSNGGLIRATPSPGKSRRAGNTSAQMNHILYITYC